MELNNELKELIEKIKSEPISSIIKTLEGSEFGLYLPVYADGDRIKPMLKGYSQTEKNLLVSVSKKDEDIISGAKPIAWIGGKFDKDSTCTHGGVRSCSHCTGHSADCRHCTGHSGKILGKELDAPKLDYDLEVKKLINKKDLLEKLAGEGFGLTLLHGHNNKHTFTKLPKDYISVISNGKTTFRTKQEVENDLTFVPNMWRAINGKLEIAGGYSSVENMN